VVIEHVLNVHDDEILWRDVITVQELPVSISLVDDKQDRALATANASSHDRNRSRRAGFHLIGSLDGCLGQCSAMTPVVSRCKFRGA